MSLSRCKSLTEKNQFEQLLRKKPTRIGCFEVYKQTVSEESLQREIGFIIPKRQVKLAVLRNKIKRLAHETLRLSSDKFWCLVKVNRLITKKNIQEQMQFLKNALTS